ncbi:MAG: RNA polymerase sigma factor [Acidimicrobiales bacterium]
MTDPSVTAAFPGRLLGGGAAPADLDEATVLAAKRGEQEAWERLYHLHARGLYGFLMMRLSDRDDAAEALSETFLRALEKVSSFRGGAVSMRAWMFSIARNVATDRLRGRRRVHPVADMEDGVDLLAAAADERLIAGQDQATLRMALTTLAPEDRELLWLRVCEGLSSEETGRVLGKRPGTVRMQQLRALRALAVAMGS